VFLENYMHSRPLTWLDAEINTNFSIDVYRHSFPTDRGCTVISRGRVPAGTQMRTGRPEESAGHSRFPRPR
jgi:hypothetical protein